MFVLLLTLAGCIGQKGEKKADCAAGQAFDQRSRQCVGAQKPPTPLLDDITVIEDQGPQEIVLQYTDPNGSEATSCKVNFTSANVWMRAPEWDTSAARAGQAHTVAFTAANSISPVLNPVERGNAFVQEGFANAARLNAAAARTNSQMAQSLRVIADALRNIGNIAINIPDSLVQARGADALNEANNMDALAVVIDNMCGCIGGICKTVAVPDKNWFGNVGFTYTISDAFGTGPVEQVTLSVQSVNDPPQPAPQDVNDFESTNSTAVPIVFTVNAARDVEDDIFSNFFTYTVTNGTNFGSYIQFPKGRLYDCMGIGGSAVTDRTCNYTPTSGNDFGVGTQAAAFNFQGIDWFAKSTGTWGNNITITMVEHPITRMGGLNGANGEDTVDIKVVGNDVTIMVESHAETVGVDNYDAHTVQNVIDAINADPYASAILTVAANAPAATPVSTGTVTLGTGLDGLDTIEYKVNDGLSDSSWSGVATINVFAQDDFPLSTATVVTLTEDTPASIPLGYFDAEGSSATGCTAQGYAGQIRAGSSCACAAGSCSVTIKPFPHQTATSSFEYRVTVAAGANNVGAFSNPDVTVNITPVNDPPYTVVSQITPTPNESATAFPSDITFSLPSANEVEGEGMSYTLKTLPTKGTLSGCVASNTVGVAINTGVNCVYTPNNGNDNGIGVAGSFAQGGITYQARFAGTAAGNIQFNMIQDFGVVAANPIIEYEQESIPGTLVVNIYVALAGATTANDVGNAINTHPYIGQMVFANVTAGGTAQANFGPLTLGPGSSNPMDFFEYDVKDSSGAGNDTALFIGRHHITMNPTDDFPMVCDYTKFKDAPECGLLGCIGDTVPVGNIIPNKEGVSYYHKASAVCYKSRNLDSSGPLSNLDWEIVTDNVYIADQYVNEMEKIVIDGIRADEGGGDTTEDIQALLISAVPGDITSSNPTLIPVNNIKFFHAGTEYALGASFGGPGSADADEFKIELTPAINQTGSSDISFKIGDGANLRTVSFKVTVNPVSIKHNGWKNISAIGPGVDSINKITDMSKVCNYSRTKCSGGECKGSNDPVNVISPDKKYAIYYNTLSKQCFYADGTTNADWKILDSYCNISPVEFVPNCAVSATPNDEGSCIGTATPAGSIIPAKENQFFFDVTNNVCYRSRDLTSNGLDNSDWETYKATGQVTLEWEDFTVFGLGVLSGFNVYRRLAGEEFDYDAPINKQVIGPSVRKYLDNAENSWYAPVPKTVYYYDVRPILNGLPTGERQDFNNFNIVRLIVPDQNKAFVHRWIVNNSVCKMMNSTTIDPQNNFRCLYLGPGSTDIGSTDVYDIGTDMIVDRFEAGCNFDRSPACDTPTGDCVSNVNPAVSGSIDATPTVPDPVTAPLGTIFYDRSSGTCFRNTNGAQAWSAIDGAAASRVANEHEIAQNPPLVNFQQVQAYDYCRDAGATTYNAGTLGYSGGTARALPNRKEQIAYSLWDDVLNTDTQISILETGLSINSSSKCNSSNASGLESGYSDTPVTNSNTKYALPGTTASNIRSVITGSDQTNLCVSRFGVQDHVGNVAEHTVDRIDCDGGNNSGLSTCESINGADGAASLTYTVATDNVTAPAWDEFRVNSTIGPCRDTDSDGECDSFIDKWILDEERYSAGRFFVPMGLPVHVNYNSTFSSDPIIDYTVTGGNFNFLSEIGPSSGILADKLHDDVFAPNTHHLYSTLTNVGQGTMTTGGSYLSGSGAGLWTAEFRPRSSDGLGFVTVGDVSFRRKGGFDDIKIAIQTGGAGVTTCTVDDPESDATNNRVLISLSTTPANAEAQDVRAAVDATPACFALVDATVSGGDTTAVQVTTTADVNITNISVQNNAPNVGFRCVYPINEANYQP